MSHYFERFLADIFKAEGSTDPEGAAKRASEAMKKAQWTDETHLAKAERDAKIYELRKTMTAQELAIRFGLSPREVFRRIKVQISIRKVS